MIKGMRTVIYPVGDLEAGKKFYAKATGVEPYFDQPFYVGFNVGGFELGLIPDGKPGIAGGVAHWGVDDADATHAALLAIGAKEHEAPKDVGDGIKVASVLDPFGNVFAIVQNPHFDPKAVR